MHIKLNNIFFVAFVAIASLCGLYARDCDYDKPYIFVSSEDDIPEDLAERQAYFFVLLDWEKILVEAFTGYLEMLYGNILSPHYLERYPRVEALKDDFFSQTEVIQYAGLNMTINDQYSQEELYDYQRMIGRANETLNQIFRR